MKIQFTPEALQAIRLKRAWWESNREEAPRLFRDELFEMTAKLGTGAAQGEQLYTVRAKREIWRLLLPKTQTHVYYRLTSSGEDVEIISVWNEIGGENPGFGQRGIAGNAPVPSGLSAN